MVVEVIEGTPTWVFVLLGYLVWRAARRLGPTALSLQGIFITPAIFVLWGLYGLTQRPGSETSVLTHWLPGALLGGALGALGFLASREFRVDTRRRVVLFPGSLLPLLRVIVIFGAHYALSVAAVLHSADRTRLINWDISVSGASAGYFLVWAAAFIAQYRRAPRLESPEMPETTTSL